MDRPKIIISNYDSLGHPVYSGGGAVAVSEIAKRLAGDFEVNVLCGRFPGSKNKTTSGVRYTYIGLWLGPYISQLIFQLLLPFYILTLKFDIWIEGFTPPFSTACLPLLTKKPVIGWLHMLCGPDMKRKYLLPFDLFERWGLTLYKNIITTSEALKKKVQLYNSDALIEVIPNGINPIKYSKQSKKKHLLFLGRIEINQKGLDLLIAAYGLISQETDYPLLIAGGGAEKEMTRLKNIIKKLKLEKKIKIVGRVSGDKKIKLLLGAVCMVVPSRYETFSITSLEALGYGIPLIVFDIEGLSWIPKNCRVTARAFSSEDLAKQIIKVTRDRDLQLKLVNRSKIFSQDLTWEKLANKYQEVLLTKFGLI